MVLAADYSLAAAGGDGRLLAVAVDSSAVAAFEGFAAKGTEACCQTCLRGPSHSQG